MDDKLRKPFRIIGGCFYTDSDFNPIKFTKQGALKLAKQLKTGREKRFTNNFKYKHFELIEKPDYFCMSLS